MGPGASFLAALEQGSLLGAVRQLKSSQPTIGRHVAEQESQLGVLLFERTGRGLLPTAMALQLAGAARAMEAGAHQLSLSVSGASSAVVGTVRITASQPAGSLLRIAAVAGADAARTAGYPGRAGCQQCCEQPFAPRGRHCRAHGSAGSGFAALGYSLKRENFAFRSDDLIAS